MPSHIRACVCAGLLSLTVLLAGGAEAGSDADANALFVRAVQGWQAVQEIEGDEIAPAERRHRGLIQVNAALTSIVEEYSGSDLAVRLIIGERVGPISLSVVQYGLRSAEIDLGLARCASQPSVACLLSMAKDLVEDLDGEAQSYRMASIAAAEARAGQFEQSLRYAETIKVAKYRERALSNISASLAEAGYIPEALAVASRLSYENAISDAYQAIVSALIEADDLEQANSLIAKITVSHQRREVITELATEFAAAGRMEEALERLNEVNPFWVSVVMRDLSARQLLEQNYDLAWQTALKISDPGYLCEATIDIAYELEGHDLVDSILSMVRALPDDGDKERCFRAIGIRTGRPDLLAAARELSAQGGWPAQWPALTAELKAGLWSEAEKTALAVDEGARRSQALANLSRATLRAGRTEYAQRSLPYLLPHDEAEVRGMLWSVDGRQEHIERMKALARDAKFLKGQAEVSSFIWSVGNPERLQAAADMAAEITNDRF